MPVFDRGVTAADLGTDALGGNMQKSPRPTDCMFLPSSLNPLPPDTPVRAPPPRWIRTATAARDVPSVARASAVAVVC
jgi:hypothetical protein